MFFVSFDKFKVCMGFYDKQNEWWILNYSSFDCVVLSWKSMPQFSLEE